MYSTRDSAPLIHFLVGEECGDPGRLLGYVIGDWESQPRVRGRFMNLGQVDQIVERNVRSVSSAASGVTTDRDGQR